MVRMKRVIFYMVYAFFYTFLGIGCKCITPPPVEEKQITITDPQEGDAVPRIVTVKGRTKDVPTGARIWVYVWPQGTTTSYRQTNPGIVMKDGDWESLGCILGQKKDVGQWFTIWGQWEKDYRTIISSDTVNVMREYTDTTKFGFEENDMGWEANIYDNTQAIYFVEQTSEEYFLGSSSLKMMVDFIGSDTARGQGEAMVDLRYHRPEGVDRPVNLDGAEISAWIKAPQGAGGLSGKKNYFQIFVKDSNWKSEYGMATYITEAEDNIKKREGWFEITLVIGKGETRDPDFDPRDIILMGAKLGADSTSTYKYRGPIYLDAFDW